MPALSTDKYGLFEHFESGKIQVKGIVVNDYAQKYSHWNAVESLGMSGVPFDSSEAKKSLNQQKKLYIFRQSTQSSY